MQTWSWLKETNWSGSTDSTPMSITNSSRLARSRVYVAGHRWLAGSAIFGRLEPEHCAAIIARTHAELDLADQVAVSHFSLKGAPSTSFLPQQKSVASLPTHAYPAEFISENLAIRFEERGRDNYFPLTTDFRSSGIDPISPTRKPIDSSRLCSGKSTKDLQTCRKKNY